MTRMRYVPLKRVGPLWVVLTAWEFWKRLPPPVRKRLMKEATKRGPAAARAARRAAERAFVERGRPPQR
jgi:hypothetical protein